jgi:hypothetical protein
MVPCLGKESSIRSNSMPSAGAADIREIPRKRMNVVLSFMAFDAPQFLFHRVIFWRLFGPGFQIMSMTRPYLALF